VSDRAVNSQRVRERRTLQVGSIGGMISCRQREDLAKGKSKTRRIDSKVQEVQLSRRAQRTRPAMAAVIHTRTIVTKPFKDGDAANVTEHVLLKTQEGHSK
jgi:hypothetical protein